MIAILVLTTVVVFVLVDGMLRLSRQAEPIRAQAAPAAFDPQVSAGLFVHPGHTWVQLTSSGVARVGADEFARRAVHDIDQIRWPRVGTHVRQGDPLMTLERGDRHLTLPAPLSGEVTAYDAGRGGPGQAACMLRPSRLHEELRQLRIAEAARQWLGAEKRRLADWLAGASTSTIAATLPDGGSPVEGFLEHLPEDRWQEFERQFCAAMAPQEQEAAP